jgi:hypothetical protein
VIKFKDIRESVNESCGLDHSTMTGTCPECGKELSEDAIEENMKGIAKALTSLSGKTEYKKVAKNLKSLAMRAAEGDKGAAKQIKTQLAKLATKVDKKSGAKLTKMSKLAATYESVEIKEAPSPKISQDITDKLNWLAVYTHPTSRFAKAAIKDNGKGYVKDFKKLSDMIEDAIEVYDRIKKEIGLNEEVELKESVELDEKVSLSKKGNYEVTVDGKSSVGIRISLRYKGKQIVTGTKVDGKFVMAFEPVDGNNKLPKGAKEIKKGKYVHIAFAKVDDVIAYAKFGDITEAVSVDSRTKGYKEAVKRGIILAQKREAKKAKLEAQKQKEMEEDIANSTGVNIAGIDKPLGKVKKRKSFKESLTVL